MVKYHINKHGVPAPCHAKDGNCPLGGVSGNENHFDNLADAEQAAQKIHESKFSVLPGINDVEEYSYDSQELEDMRGKQIAVEYDGKYFAGEVIGTHYVSDGNDNNGLIIQGNDGTVKHIKTHRLNDVKVEGGSNNQSPKPRAPKDLNKEASNLISKLDSNVKIKEPEIEKHSIRLNHDLESLIELRARFITTQEHDPIKNVQSMFDHVADRSGKLYRYNDTDNPYLETYGYDFEQTVSRHNNFLTKNGYYDDYDEDDYFENEYGITAKDAFEADYADHRELHSYTSDLAIEYGKDYEKNVYFNDKYTSEEKEELRNKYKEALVAKVNEFIEED